MCVHKLSMHCWYVSEKGWKKLKIEDGCTKPDVERILLDSDIKDFGAEHIDEDWRKKKEFFTDGVLQLQKISNVTAPKIDQESTAAPRLFKVVLTDGVHTVVALEWSRWRAVTSNTAPGTKIKLTAPVSVDSGFLLVPDNALKVMGGVVPALHEKWLVSKSFSNTRSRPIDGNSGPPPWIPFGSKRTTKLSQPDKNFKSFGKDSMANEDDDGQLRDEFSDLRQVHIAEAHNVSTNIKQFTNTAVKRSAIAEQCRVVSANSTSGPDSNSRASDTRPPPDSTSGYRDGDGRGARRGRGRGRGRVGRGSQEQFDDTSEQYSRPSQLATLLEFVDLRISPAELEESANTNYHADSAVSAPDRDRSSLHTRRPGGHQRPHTTPNIHTNTAARDYRDQRESRDRRPGQGRPMSDGERPAPQSEYVYGTRARRRAGGSAQLARGSVPRGFRPDSVGQNRVTPLLTDAPTQEQHGRRNTRGSGRGDHASSASFSGTIEFHRGGGGRSRRRRFRGR